MQEKKKIISSKHLILIKTKLMAASQSDAALQGVRFIPNKFFIPYCHDIFILEA